MDRETVKAFAHQLGDYIEHTNLKHVNILFHGGEPLLQSPDFYDYATGVIRTSLPSTCRPDFCLQTNGSLLNDEIIAMLYRNQISVSLSIDGPASAQDRHRLFANGKSSYKAVTSNIYRLMETPMGIEIYNGILAVVDLRNDPIEVFNTIKQFSTPKTGIDFLWPDGNFSAPPPGVTDFRSDSSYADWMIPIFDAWYSQVDQGLSIRIFENIITLLLGGRSDVEGLGEQELSVLTIETDGEIRDSDVLAVAYNNASRFGKGFNIHYDSIRGLLESRDFKQHETDCEHCQECQECSWNDVCGGGLLPHRYSEENQYNNPSIYCGNLRRLFQHIRGVISEDLKQKRVIKK